MRLLHQPHRILRLGLAALTLALELATIAPATGFAQAQPAVLPASSAQGPTAAALPAGTAQTSVGNGSPSTGVGGALDYPVSGGPTNGSGWFYSQEAKRWPAITGLGPVRPRGYTVLDDDKGNFWTEFRRFGGVDVLGYPVSQVYHYPKDGLQGLWYQAFERGILQYHPETGRAEMANVFEQFSEADPCPPGPLEQDVPCLDRRLQYLGIPLPKSTTGPNDGFYATEQRMGWLTEPRFLARYFFDPVGFHSSESDRPGQSAFATQEQAWAFFGLPQGGAEKMVLRVSEKPSAELWPLFHSFVAQRFQKGGLQLFMENTAEQFDPTQTLAQPNYPFPLVDPTIVPGDGQNGCVALTAVGLLARSIGVDKMIPKAQVQPVPADPNPHPYFITYIPPTTPSQLMVQFQVEGTEFAPDEPVTITLSGGQGPSTGTAPGGLLQPVTISIDKAYPDGSFDQVVNARIGTYTLTATNKDKSGRTYSHSTVVNLAIPSDPLALVNASATCRPVGLPISN